MTCYVLLMTYYALLMTCYVLLMTFYALLMTYLMHYLTYDLYDLRRKPYIINELRCKWGRWIRTTCPYSAHWNSSPTP